MQSNRFGIVVAVVMLLQCFFQTDSQAQRGGVRGFLALQQVNLLSRLLGIEEVRKELSLTDNQSDAARELSQQMTTALQEELDSLGDADEQERRELQAEIESELQVEEMEALAGLLNDGQINRLRELSIQQRGAQAVADAQVADALMLSDDQRKRVEDAVYKSQQELQFEMEQMIADSNFQGLQAARDASQKRLEALVMGLLTQDQKAKLEALKGKAFTFPRRGGRPRSDF